MDIRTVTEDELGAWGAAMDVGFLRVPDYSKEVREQWADYLRDVVDLSRTRGAFDGDQCVGTFRSWGGDIIVPGGAAVSASAITNVTVSATHRRRGLLTRMMRADLDASAARGEALAVLIAAEYRIYGRFGFGPATDYTVFRVDLTRTRLTEHTLSLKEDGGSVAIVPPETFVELGPAIHDAFRRRTPGALSRQELWFPLYSRVRLRPSGHNPDPRFYAVYRDASGTPTGYLAYRVEESWEDFVPKATLHMDQLIAADRAAEVALWEFATQVDYVARISAGERASDDLLRGMFTDPRAVTWDSPRDFVWVRPLDVPAALSARTYPVAGRLVLEVEDELGYAAGRFALDGGPQGAVCTRTDEPAHLVLGASALGSLYLGGGSAVRLAAQGAITELIPGSLELAEVMFRTARGPWCPDWF
ncbi:GNAT family N-acetyltransferase [Yinghuangia seranimata]|uniref:GNAT family N-acetyltransferase n=1 Tax=Yinghuangia seranimata TaxID=408067 RepID=UPI00248B4958|nr:GNAT family N-acetyltransferase [Yinghuangia seranimata]MDI2126288.1 GNAT family N-acetyltransferase [Yinghuangia seranimata]